MLKQVVGHLEFRLRCYAALVDYNESTKKTLEDINIMFPTSLKVKELLEANPTMLPVPENICCHLQCAADINESVVKAISTVATSAELDLLKETWASVKSALKVFEKGLTQAVRDSKSYVEKQAKEASCLEKAEQKKREKDQVEQYRQVADQRARALLANKSQAGAKPIYKACQFIFEKVSTANAAELPGLSVKPFAEMKNGCAADMELPWFATDKEFEALANWVANPAIQKTTEAWVLKYKTLGDYAQKGRCSGALEPKHGREECDELFSKFVPAPLDASGFHSCENFLKTAFICGYSPDMRFAGLQANGALTLKAGLLGEVLHVSASLASLQTALEKSSILARDKALANPEAFCEVVENLDMKALTELAKHGLELFYHKHVTGEIVAIPLGWFSIEMTMKGSLVVSARKGYFLQKTGEGGLKEYRSLRSLFRRCGKNVDRYEEMIKLLSSAKAEK